MTIRLRLIIQIRRYPGCSAWMLAKGLNLDNGTVSGVLKKMADRGEVLRRERPSRPPLRTAWIYYPKKLLP